MEDKNAKRIIRLRNVTEDAIDAVHRAGWKAGYAAAEEYFADAVASAVAKVAVAEKKLKKERSKLSKLRKETKYFSPYDTEEDEEEVTTLFGTDGELVDVSIRRETMITYSTCSDCVEFARIEGPHGRPRGHCNLLSEWRRAGRSSCEHFSPCESEEEEEREEEGIESQDREPLGSGRCRYCVHPWRESPMLPNTGYCIERGTTTRDHAGLDCPYFEWSEDGGSPDETDDDNFALEV